MQRLLSAALVVASVTGFAEAGGKTNKSRFWSDNTGAFTVHARLLGCDSNEVSLQLDDGERVRVSLRRLSDADREWLRLQKYIGTEKPIEVGGVEWFPTLKDAQEAALGSAKRSDDKPIMCFRALGDLSGFM